MINNDVVQRRVDFASIRKNINKSQRQGEIVITTMLLNLSLDAKFPPFFTGVHKTGGRVTSMPPPSTINHDLHGPYKSKTPVVTVEHIRDQPKPGPAITNPIFYEKYYSQHKSPDPTVTHQPSGYSAAHSQWQEQRTYWSSQAYRSTPRSLSTGLIPITAAGYYQSIARNKHVLLPILVSFMLMS